MFKNEYFEVVYGNGVTVLSSYHTKKLYVIKHNQLELKFEINGELQYACGNIVTIANTIVAEEGIFNFEQVGSAILEQWKAVCTDHYLYPHFVGVAIASSIEYLCNC